LLYYPAAHDAPAVAGTLGVDTAWLYVLGSFGFLYVDVLEFCR
jgi:hypothetical protein